MASMLLAEVILESQDLPRHGVSTHNPFSDEFSLTVSMDSITEMVKAMGLSGRITRTAIDLARANYKRCEDKAEEANAGIRGGGGDDDSTDEGEYDQEDVAVNLEDFVIAKGVTPEDLLLVPDEWLGGDQLTLLPDGTLIFDRLASYEHVQACEAAFQAASDYVAANPEQNLVVQRGTMLNVGRQNRRSTGVVVQEITVPNGGTAVPRIIIEVVQGGHTSTRYIDLAISYLRHNPDVVRVVIFKVFSLGPASHMDPSWEIPALAIVFGLVDSNDRGSPVRMYETHSFGNVGLDEDAIDILCGNPEIDDLVPLEDDQISRPAGVQCVIRGFRATEDLSAIQPEELPFEVALPTPLTAMRFDLIPVFAAVVQGRKEDMDNRRAETLRLREATAAAKRAARRARVGVLHARQPFQAVLAEPSPRPEQQ